MPPPRRGTRHRRTAATAKSTRASRQLSVRHGGEPFKRENRRAGGAAPVAAAGDDDDGLPLNDESLLLIFTALSSSTADLVRCAATCRRWRRLVSADAAFICRRAPPWSSDDVPFIPTLALGFFFSHHSPTDTAPPRFVPLSAAGSRLLPSLAALVDDGAASRVVASRAGRLVLDLRRRRRASSRNTNAGVKLGVCNPVMMTTAGGGGGVDVLPPLRGKDSPTGPYACTVITAADEDGSVDDASYRVVLLYNRRSFTALRCFSSDAGVWGPEAVVTGARIGRNHLAVGQHAAVVHDGFVFWPRLAMAVRLDSLLLPPPEVEPAAAAKNKVKTPTSSRHTVAGISLSHPSRKTMEVERLLGVMPDGRMIRVEADSETIRAYWGGGAGGGLMGEKLEWRWTMKQALMRVHGVRLRWICEKSGLVIFTAMDGHGMESHVYTVDVETKQLRRVAACGEPALGEMIICGYEMDRVTLLASLGR